MPDTCEDKLARLSKHIKELETGRSGLLTEIGGLEDEVTRLEAEDLRPLVDRLRQKIHHILELLEAMATEQYEEEIDAATT